MNAMEWGWLISAVALVTIAAVVGFAVKPRRGILGILIDDRGRFSLSHFQVTLWTLVVLSLVVGVFFGRLADGVKDPLGFSIPAEVLGLMGIAAGSSLAAVVTKSQKDGTDADARIAASDATLDPPRLAQIFLLEEGSYADQVVDITKFQNFVITLVLVVAYVAEAIHVLDKTSAVDLTTLPSFSGTFLTLLGISHASYIGAKLPTRTGTAPGLTVANRAVAIRTQALPAGVAARNHGRRGGRVNA